ncbi:NUMOD4 domain-containing protein [Pantoea sp.]|uniref:NUMOD4 domain-containing protein n=1 Tax=Pantoea sp. TaxID=69393 RepID=UPI00290CAFB1|nr:NUMOD4 domain-containing protein [Pantoea sp.]MDU5475929.1 NUMOD4 domain-containing protein [Pantoea sp.]
MNAEWKDIPGFEGLYQASINGEIKSVPREVLRKDGSTRFYSGKPVKQYLRKSGYLDVKLSKGGKQHTFLSHRVIALTFISNPENKPAIDHLNGVKNDNRAVNLEWVTAQENNQRLWSAGRGNNPKGREAKRFRCPIKAMNYDTGEVIILCGTAEIKAAGFNPHNVTACLQGYRRTCRGFSFIRLE